MPAFQNYYEILGLDAPPQDRKTIKLAYSKKLKVTRPEEDPDGFMRLRDAHDTALNVLANQAQQAAWAAEQKTAQEIAPETGKVTAEAGLPEEPSLTYEDMLPEETQQQTEDTSYSIGRTPSLEAPSHAYEPIAPATPPLMDDLEKLLSTPQHYNDREMWNQLFRNARQLDIDDYVDFEHLLMDVIIRFHGYYDRDDYHNTPEKMPQKFSPSITASLFKTMSWDQVNTQGYRRSHQVEWLARRMHVHTRRDAAASIPITPPEKSGSGLSIWVWIIGAFILLKIIQALAHA